MKSSHIKLGDAKNQFHYIMFIFNFKIISYSSDELGSLAHQDFRSEKKNSPVLTKF